MGLGERALQAQLVEYAKEFIDINLKSGDLPKRGSLELSTSNAPSKPRFDVNLEEFIVPTGFEVRR